MTAPAAPAAPGRGAVSRARTWLATRLPVVGWAITAGMGILAISQAFGFSWIPLLWTVQAFTPLVLAPAVPVAVIAAVRRRWAVAVVHTGLVCCLVVLVTPLVAVDAPASAPPSAPRLTVAHGNVYYRTDRPAEVAAAMVATGADVLAMTEYSDAVADALGARDDVRAAYPFVAADAPGDRNGIAVWSRFPIVAHRIERLAQSLAADVTVEVDGVPVRVLVVHPLPGTDRDSLNAWAADLAKVGAVVNPRDPSVPTVVVGDFNATRWHPALRDLLDDGWRSAHEALGAGWSRSWPSDLPGPAFVRIDHALLGDGVTPVDVRDVVLPGSDHLGFVVQVALTH